MISLTEADTLIAVFKLGTSTNESEVINARIFPNPTRDIITLEYDLPEATEVNISLYNTIGSKVKDFNVGNTKKSAGNHNETLNLASEGINDGFYQLVLEAGTKKKTFKISVIN